MKLHKLSFLVLFLISLGCYGQTQDAEFDQGSEITIDQLTERQHQNLYKLGKIWGFVKYYHPEIAKGNINWDDELFRILPALFDASTEEQMYKEIIDWIPALGNIEANNKISHSEQELKLTPDTEWTKNTHFLSAELCAILSAIQNVEKPEEHYYIGFDPNNGSPIFKNEKKYEEMDFADQREGQSLDKEIACVDIYAANFWRNDTPSHKILDGNIGYLYLGSLQKGKIDEVMKKLSPTKGLIIDLRSYPAFILFDLSNYLMPQPTEFVKFTFGSLAAPGQFTFSQPFKVGEENADYYKGKVVIIVNEITQSRAEYTTMALRVAPDATVIGSTTAGADGEVSIIYLPGNIRTRISGIGVYYPDGTETQRVGIVPDIEIKPTLAGIKQGKDELLEKAIALINE